MTKMTKRTKVRLKKGDKVIVIAGRDKGQTGTVAAVLPRQGLLVVEGVNTARRHIKPRLEAPQGGIINVDRPIAVSKVALVDPESSQPTRTGYRLDPQSGQKQRFAKRSRVVV